MQEEHDRLRRLYRWLGLSVIALVVAGVALAVTVLLQSAP